MPQVKNLSLFFNNYRGLNTLTYLINKKDLSVKKIYLSKRFLNKKIIKSLNRLKLSFEIIKSINNSRIINEIKKNQVDLNILCGFPYILKDKAINSAKLGTINLHAGKLPNYRGGSPLNWQIINGEKKIGISVIKVDKGVDTGPVIRSKDFKLKNSYNIKKVHEITNNLFPKLTYLSILDVFFNKIPRKKINKKKSYLYPQRNEMDGEINWRKMTNKDVFNFVRAISKPYPGAFTFNSNKEKIKIYECKISKKKI